MSLIPAPWNLVAKISAVLLVLLTIYTLGRHDGAEHVRAQWAMEKQDRLAAELAAEKTARQREQALINQVKKAENDANDREEKRRAAVAAADSAADRLRLAINTIRNGLPGASAAARRATSDAALAVFGDCAAAIGKLADEADGIASDRQTLIEAWPK